MNFEETLTKMQEKIGKDESMKIADDIASLLSYENARNKELNKREKRIEKLEKDKEMLIEANGNLLQQVSVASEEELKPKAPDTEEKKPINIRDAFDKNGNFIK